MQFKVDKGLHDVINRARKLTTLKTLKNDLKIDAKMTKIFLKK
jgi:hypothetical protein